MMLFLNSLAFLSCSFGRGQRYSKKGACVFSQQPKSMRCTYIQQHLSKYQPAALCEALSVSRRPTIAADVQAQGFAVGVRTVGRVMRSLGLRAKSGRKFKCTTDSNHKYGTWPNLLNRHFMVIRPNQV
jgi:hypothetical protein